MAKKEAEEKVTRAMSERDEAIKAFEVKKADQKVREEVIREEAVKKIVQYGMTFRQSVLFMVKEKYPDLDFSDINFLDMRGHDSPNLSGPVQAASVQPVEEGRAQVEEVRRIKGSVEADKVQAETTEETILDARSLVIESGANNVKNVVLVPSD